MSADSYDLRFPEWSRNTKADRYDLLIYVANWPEVRSAAWEILLKARAVENQCYVAGVNRVGADGKLIHYTGYSAVVEPKGQVIYNVINTEEIKTVTLLYDDLQQFRDKFTVLL